ncbi:hypothetical protein DFP72DRAFT_847981 [Ephemerocybe angulata]|uniref:Uncharacterized protein n=1 Tax=Ephemerocybe angulata TaxID=980116 RepID=A0A8H6HYY3_9AGAR|nr:hypothetical protein DFP72DRAFT_847981 [Tulosesus angulatus]
MQCEHLVVPHPNLTKDMRSGTSNQKVVVLELIIWDKNTLKKSLSRLTTGSGEGRHPSPIRLGRSQQQAPPHPFSLDLLSTKSNTIVTGSVQLKLGFVASPNCNEIMRWEAVYWELSKRSRPSLVSAPATEGVGTVRSNQAGPDLLDDDGGLSSSDSETEDELDEDEDNFVDALETEEPKDALTPSRSNSQNISTSPGPIRLLVHLHTPVHQAPSPRPDSPGEEDKRSHPEDEVPETPFEQVSHVVVLVYMPNPTSKAFPDEKKVKIRPVPEGSRIDRGTCCPGQLQKSATQAEVDVEDARNPFEDVEATAENEEVAFNVDNRQPTVESVRTSKNSFSSASAERSRYSGDVEAAEGLARMSEMEETPTAMKRAWRNMSIIPPMPIHEVVTSTSEYSTSSARIVSGASMITLLPLSVSTPRAVPSPTPPPKELLPLLNLPPSHLSPHQRRVRSLHSKIETGSVDGLVGSRVEKDLEKRARLLEANDEAKQLRKKAFQFEGSNDIVGIVMLEIQRADDLPRLSNINKPTPPRTVPIYQSL